MKKRTICLTIVATIAIVTGWKAQSNNNVKLSDLAKANIEALASNSEKSCKWRTGCSSVTGWIAICDEYGVGYDCECGSHKEYPKEDVDTNPEIDPNSN